MGTLIWGALSKHLHPGIHIGAPLYHPCVGIPVGVPPSQHPYLAALIWAPTPQSPQFGCPHPKIPTGSLLCGHPCRCFPLPPPPALLFGCLHPSTHHGAPTSQPPPSRHPYWGTPILTPQLHTPKCSVCPYPGHLIQEPPTQIPLFGRPSPGAHHQHPLEDPPPPIQTPLLEHLYIAAPLHTPIWVPLSAPCPTCPQPCLPTPPSHNKGTHKGGARIEGGGWMKAQRRTTPTST